MEVSFEIAEKIPTVISISSTVISREKIAIPEINYHLHQNSQQYFIRVTPSTTIKTTGIAIGILYIVRLIPSETSISYI